MNAPSDDPSGEPSPVGSPAGMAPLDPQSLHEAKSVGNPASACIGGVAGAVAGALLWAAIAAMTNSHIGWTAIGVGFLVGKAMRLLGRGASRAYGLVGAVLSVLGCVAGNVLTVATVTSRAKAVPLAEMLHFFATSPRATAQVLILTFEPADLLFYGIAAWAGYWFAFGGTAEARIERARRPSLPQSAVTAGSPMPSLYRILQKDAAAGSFFALALTPWLCWLLAWMGIGWSQASPPTIQRWFLIAALAISAVCLPLLLRRMLVIRGIFAYPAEVDGQVVQIPPRSGWKTLVIEYGYRSEKYRVGYTVSNASHPDQRLQVGDSVRLLVNDRKPRHAIPLSMFG